MSRKIVMDFIKRTSGTPRQIYIPFYLLDICGDSYDAAVLMNQILFWSDDPHRRKDGWYAAPYEKITRELRLSKFRVMNAMKILSALGVETKSMISPRHKYTRVVHYRINEEIFMKIIEDYLKTEDSTSWNQENEFHNETWNQENEFHESEFVDAVSSKKKREIEERVKDKKTLASRYADADGSSKWPDASQEVSSLRLQGDEQKTARAQIAENHLSKATATDSPPVAPAPPKEKSILAWIIDDAWSGKEGKRTDAAGMSTRLIPVLMGRSKKYDCLDPIATEPEIYGFVRWYRWQHPNTSLPMEGKLASWFGQWRASSDYPSRLETSTHMVERLYHASTPAPVIEEGYVPLDHPVYANLDALLSKSTLGGGL